MSFKPLIQFSLCFAFVAGLAGWMVHPALFQFLSEPISGWMDAPRSGELLAQRLKSAVAFSALGALIPMAAFAGRGKGIPVRSLCILTALSVLSAFLTARLIHADMVTLSEFTSQFDDADPDIPMVASSSLIPIHRVALYPACLMLVLTIVMAVRAKSGVTKRNLQGHQTPS